MSKVLVSTERSIASPGGSREFIQELEGSRIGKWIRRGKYLLAYLHEEDDKTSSISAISNRRGMLGVHLRMTGYFQFLKEDLGACPHTRVRIWNRQGSELRFVDTRNFGQMWWVPPGNPPENVISGLKHLGPEPFSKAFNSRYLKQRLQSSRRPIKSALLDQSVVAGAGNIYADESLFKAGILPHTQSNKLSDKQLEALCKSLKDVLKESIGKGGTTFSDFRDLNGINGKYGGQAWVYRRGGQPCRQCSTKLMKGRLSGRSTHWCPRCQL